MKKNNARDILRYFYYKMKYPKMKIRWKKNYINLTINDVRFKFPLGINNLKRKTFFYHLNNFEFPDVNLFKVDLQGYFKDYILKENDVIIDAGAYTGIFSIYCAVKIKNTGKIIAFEPNKDSVKLLKKAIDMNNLSNIEIVEKGVWNKKETLNFVDKGVCSEITKGKGDYSIDVIDLDTQIKEMKIMAKDISFVKMDIEGAEIEAIDGMKKILKEGKPKLAIASYHIVNGEKTYKEVEKKLKAIGYKVKTGYPEHLTTYAKK